MSWYTDPRLFIYWSSYYGKFRVCRIHRQYSVINPIQGDDYYSDIEDLNFYKHLSFGNNRESDFDLLKSRFPRTSGGDFKYINCQGLVVNWIERIKMGIWSREELESNFYSLPGLPLTGSGARLLSEKRALETKVSATEAKLSTLQYEANRNKDEKQVQVKIISDLQAGKQSLDKIVSELKNEKQARTKTISDLQAGKQSLDKIVSDLQAENSLLRDELEKERDTKSGLINDGLNEETWTGTDTVPSHLVPFEDLDVLLYARNIPMTITKALGAPKFSEDNTTNVRRNRFYQGVFPIVIVNVDELIPKEKARFDPEFWGLYQDTAGIRYAARKLFESEVQVNEHKTC